MLKPGNFHKNCGGLAKVDGSPSPGRKNVLPKESPFIVAINRGPDIPEYISQYVKCQRYFFGVISGRHWVSKCCKGVFFDDCWVELLFGVV